jgi:hypothetical protein
LRVFGGEKGTGGSELGAGVRVGGGQPGSSAKGGRSLAVDHPGEARNYVGRRMAATGGATRSGGSGPRDRPSAEEPGTEGFRVNISVPEILCGEAT